ncbi:MAG: TetR/AcrR family transcriptional regulator [Clostridia bacterium]|nr:TetR/AcrR family transcriptional regulator [Clostridia bacterium]
MPEIREPKQKRSIETKKKIIAAAYKQFSEVGYYSTNTAEIAKEAGVSTGIVYGYFKDKRDILLDVSEVYLKKVYAPILKMLDSVDKISDREALVVSVLDGAIKAHKKNAKMHEALHSLTHTDEAVNAKFMALESDVTEQFFEKLTAIGYAPDGLREKVHLSMNLIQSFCHEFVYDKHAYIDYDKMRGYVEKILLGLLQKVG